MGRRKGSWTGKANPRWNGGRYVAANGYAYIQLPDHPNADKRGYVRENIAVMSAQIGRPIAANEVVHHINGIRDDNRPENLQVMLRGVHHSHHHKGVLKPASLKNLRPMTSAWGKAIWAKRGRKTRTCEECGTTFVGTRKKQYAHVYCSKRCGGIAAARERSKHR